MTSDVANVLLLAEGTGRGGIERHVENLIQALRQPRDGVHVALFEESVLQHRLEALGAHVSVFPGGGRSALFRWIERLVVVSRADVLHAHGLVAEILCAGLRLGRRPARMLATVHSLPGDRRWRAAGRSPLAALGLWASRRFAADRLIAVTHDIQRCLIRLGIPDARIVVVPNGVPGPRPEERAEAARLRSALCPDGKAVIIGAVGRLEAVKRFDRLLQLVAVERLVHCQVWILGDGPLRLELESTARELGIDGQVRFFGHQERPEPFMSAMDLAVFCSDHEGMPFAALELMARGVPIAAFCVGGLQEIIESGSSGMLVEPYRERALGRIVADLARNGARRHALGRGAAARAQEHYSSSTMAFQTAELWRKLATAS